MTEEHFKELFGQLPLRDRLLLRVSKYMPFIIQRRILVRYLIFVVPKILEIAFRKARDEMGKEAFQKMLNLLPIRIEDKNGVWILPSGTTQEEVTEFLIQLREKGGLDKERGKVNG